MFHSLSRNYSVRIVVIALAVMGLAGWAGSMNYSRSKSAGANPNRKASTAAGATKRSLNAASVPAAEAIGSSGGGQLWHADYFMEFEGPRTLDDQFLDGQYQWYYNWRFGILSDPNGSLDSPAITVTPNPGLPLFTPFPSDATLNPSYPPYIWTGPDLNPAPQPGNSMFTSLRSTLPVPSGYPLGYDVTRDLAGGRTIAAGASEQRIFTLTLTPRDSTLTSMGANIDFNFPWQGPLPVVASNINCTGPGQVQLISSPGQDSVFWQIGTGVMNSPPLVANMQYTLTCSVTLTNTSAGPALYTPGIGVSGAQTALPIETNAATVTLTTDVNADPSDPLGEVQYDVTPTTFPVTAILDKHFGRTVHLDVVNRPADDIPPVTIATLSPASNDLDWNNTSPVTVTLNATDEPGGSGVKQITYSVNGGQNVVVAGASAQFGVTNQGFTNINYFAEDNAGNREGPRPLTVRIDTTLPAVNQPFTSPGPRVINGQNWWNSDVSVNLNAFDNACPQCSGVRRIWYSLAGAQIQPLTQVPNPSTSVLVSAEGTTSVTYYAEDRAGNLSATSVFLVNVDKTPPATTATASLPSPSITVTLTASDGQGSGVDRIVYSLSGAQNGQGAPPTQTATVVISAVGTTTITYNAVDRVGNQEQPKSLTVTVASPPPPPPPPFSLPPTGIQAVPNGACICTPLVMNTNVSGAEQWFVKAGASGNLAVTLTAEAVNPIDPETAVAKVFDLSGTPLLTVIASYPGGQPIGYQTSSSGTIATTPGAIYRVEVTTPAPTPPTQPHYRLSFCGAQEAGINSPSFPSFLGGVEENSGAWLFNVAQGEDLSVRIFSSGVPTPPPSSSPTSETFRVVWIAPDGSAQPPHFYNAMLPPGIDMIVSPDSPITPGIWTLLIEGTGISPQSQPAPSDYRLARQSAAVPIADRGIYLTWYTSGEASGHLRIVGGDGSPFTLPVDVTVRFLDGTIDLASTSTGSIDGPVRAGPLTVEIEPPAGYTAFPARQTVNATCHGDLQATFVVKDVTPPVIDPHANLTVEATSGAGAIVTFAPPATHDTADGDGVATCSPASGSTFPFGVTTVTCTAADKAGNSAVPTSFTVTVLPPPTAGGSFVIGDLNAVVGNQVTFWGDQWAKLNSLSGGSAPASFSGFAESARTQLPVCGRAWTSDPGNSSGPPAGISSYIAVIVSSSITKSGSTIAGNSQRIAIVRTNPGYDSNPGHSGTGTIVAVICQ